MGDGTRFWTKWRTRFRFCRICVWLLILFLVYAIFWLNKIGLPDFAKRPLLDALRQHGIVLQFVRLRLNFRHGLVADNVHIGGEMAGSPSLSVQEVQLQLDYRALLHRRFQLNGVILRQGMFTLPVSTTNELTSVLTLDHIQTDLRFQTNDVWSLDNFQANFDGATFVLSGQLTNAEAAADWPIFRRKRTVSLAAQVQYKKIAEALNQIRFNSASLFRLNMSGDARDVHAVSFFLAINAPNTLTPWGSARNVTVVAHSTPSPQPPGAPPVIPEINWKAKLTQLRCEQLNADSIFCAGYWRSPDLELTNLSARLGDGWLHATTRLNVATREFSFTNTACFDPEAIQTFLTPKTRDRLGQFTFQQPPESHANGSLILPEWTNRAPDWRGKVQPTILLQGQLDTTDAAFCGISFDEAHARFSYSNEAWTIPEASIRQSNSRLQIAGMEDDETKSYQWHVYGALAPDFLRPFLTEKAAREFGHFVFNQPVVLDTQVRGRLYDYDSISAVGNAALTNFSLRGESVDSVATDFQYAHRIADFYHPHLEAGVQRLRADGIRLDWPGDRIYFTNGLGTAYPQMIVDAIGPVVSQVMKPYHFLKPPTAIVNGYAPLRDPTNADLDFKIFGFAQLQCLKARTPAITGEVHWVGDTLTLTNLSAALYGGHGDAYAFFEFPQGKPLNFSFDANVNSVDLHAAANDLISPTNTLSGLLNGHFVVTSGSENWRACNGYGNVDLRDGMLLDIPIFGILSPVLNAIQPGLGSIRATDATSQFIMTNGVISTDSLEVRTSLMRLRYYGTVDLQGHLNANVNASPLRDIPYGIGPLFSTVLWPVGKAFEYKITGTWKNPKTTPVYIPKIFFDMLHPIQTLQNWLPNQNPPQKQ